MLSAFRCVLGPLLVMGPTSRRALLPSLGRRHYHPWLAHEAAVAALNDPAFWCAEPTLAAIERGEFARACDDALSAGEPGACAPREA